MKLKKLTALGATLLLSSAAVAAVSAPAQAAPLRTYSVTIENLVNSQPLSPGVVVTTRADAASQLYGSGNLITPAMARVAQAGVQTPLVDAYRNATGTTEVIDVARPITPRGSTAGGFSDTLTVQLRANANDVLTVAFMLVCTNDGFVMVDRAELPGMNGNARTMNVYGLDGGVESNTERSEDLADPCSGIGPVPLPGDPNGNDDTTTRTVPQQSFAPHPGITGGADLTSVHYWNDPVASVTVTRIS
jgi:hypothetical protein